MDWSSCDLAEQVPGKCGGRPTIKGTRIEPDTIVQDAELGADVNEIHESFPTLPVATIRAILEYAHSHHLVP